MEDTGLMAVFRLLAEVHNLVGQMSTLTYDDAYRIQMRTRKRMRYAEDELDVALTGMLDPVVKYDRRYASLDE